MTGSSHPRFRLLIGWCCLMSAALLIMTVFLAKNSFNQQPNTNTTGKESRQTETATHYKNYQKGSPPGQSLKNDIRLIIDKQKSWICSPPCQNSSLLLKNNTVEIAVGGLYYIISQVNFKNANKANDQCNQEMKKLGTITLLRNKGNGKQERKLSETNRYEAGSVSMNRMVHLMKGDSISLIINKQCMVLSTDDCHTYWEISLLSNQ